MTRLPPAACRIGLVLATALSLLAFAALASAQAPAAANPDATPSAAPRLPDVPGGKGSVRGRVVHRRRPEAVAGVQVYLYGLSASGEAGLRDTLSDAQGRFVFSDISAEPEVAYLLVARHEGVPYPGPRLRFEPGGPLDREVEIGIADATRDASRVSRVASRLLVDPDAAAFLVREAHTVTVEGDEWVAAPEAGRLLHIPLPDGLEALRFDAASALGLAPDPAGGLALKGPLPPGETTVNLQYRLPASGALVRRFGAALPLLSIYVADSGEMLLESDRLHRRRPVRTDGRIYAHFEAFEVGADETVRLSLAPLPARATLSRPARLGVFALLAIGVIGAVVAPLRAPAAAAAEAPEESATLRERDAVYAALRDLEHDHETQKIADDDYAELRGELRARAVALLRAQKEATGSAARQAGGGSEAGALPDSSPSSAAPAPRQCAACPEPLRASDRFCPQCGAPVGTPAPAPETGSAETRAGSDGPGESEARG